MHIQNTTNNYVELAIEIFNKFNNHAEEYGYENIVDIDTEFEASIAYKKDKFVPTIRLRVFYSKTRIKYDKSFISILVEDRNGNTMLNCNEIVGNYRVDIITEEDINILASRCINMLEYVFKKYSVFSRENRLDAVFNNIKQEIKNY